MYTRLLLVVRAHLMDFVNVEVLLDIQIVQRVNTMSLKTLMHQLHFLGAMEFLTVFLALGKVSGTLLW